LFNKNIVKNNSILQNIFSLDEINLIYKDINLESDEDIMLQSFYGRLYIPLYWRQKTEISDPIPLKIDPKILDIVIKKSSSFTDVELQIESISFARYALKYGIPRLHPHTDINFKEPRLTFDVQLSGTLDWPIVTETKQYLLKNNDAIIFSGTHDIHWRTKKEFNNDDYLDILLCQLSEKTDKLKTLDDNFINNIGIKQKVLKLKYDKGLI